MTERQQIERIIADAKRQPGVDVGSLAAGVSIIVETAAAVYELTIVDGHAGLVNVVSTDTHIYRATLGKFVGSAYDMAGQIMLDEWIGKGLYMHIQFRNLTFVSNVIVSARVQGHDWHYDVF